MNRKNFIFKPNLYKDYFVNFSGKDKNLIGILGYMNEFVICIVHKGMKISEDVKEISGFLKRRSQSEKIDFSGKIDQIEHKTHKSRNYTFIWLKFQNPVILSENLIAIEMANFSEED
jgi:hypothetical protein